MSLGSSLPRVGQPHSSSLARSGGGNTWKTEAGGGRGLNSEYTNYMMTPSSQHHHNSHNMPSQQTQLMGLINGNGNGPNGNGDPYMTKPPMSSDLSPLGIKLIQPTVTDVNLLWSNIAHSDRPTPFYLHFISSTRC